MKIFIDTNVWLRYVVADDAKMFAEVSSLMQYIENGKVDPYSSSIVLLEVYYVLVSKYKIKKESAFKDIKDILETRNLVLLEQTNFKAAVKIHEESKVKLVDCIIASQISSSLIFCSYDKEFAKIKRLKLQTPHEVIKSPFLSTASGS